jgi:hypothetical protein
VEITKAVAVVDLGAIIVLLPSNTTQMAVTVFGVVQVAVA